MDIKTFIEKFAQAIELDNAEGLTPETEFHDLDEWSSLSVIMVIAFFDEEFGKEIDNIAKQGQRVSDEMQTVSAATQQQSASASEIARASDSLSNLADELQTSLKRFKY